MHEPLEFVHRFEDQSADGMLSIDLDPPAGAVIRVDVETPNKIWLSANRVGWLHLARVCAELGTGHFEPGYHFHRDFAFADGKEQDPELIFEVRADAPGP